MTSWLKPPEPSHPHKKLQTGATVVEASLGAEVQAPLEGINFALVPTETASAVMATHTCLPVRHSMIASQMQPQSP
jgi:hypothetical protein